MNNLFSYCGLIDARISSSENICLYFGLVNARIRASDKDSIQLFCIWIQTDLDISKGLYPMPKTGVIRKRWIITMYLLAFNIDGAKGKAFMQAEFKSRM